MNPVKNQNNKAGLALAAAMVALTLYWAFTYSGPYRYLAELQLKQFGVYYSEATAIVIILGLLGIALGIKFLFRGAERPVPGTPSNARNVPTAMATATVSEPWLRYFRYGALLVPFGFGGWTYYNGTHAGSLQQLTAVDFQNGKLQAHLVYADVRGHLSGTYLSKEHYLYIPMSAEQNAAAPVQLVVGFIVRGVADKGLEGDVKYAFEKNGVTVGDSVWVVHAGRDPSGDKTFGLVMMGVGIVVAGLVFGLDGFRKRKRTTTKPL